MEILNLQILSWALMGGAAAGICSVRLYRFMPAGWVCDAGEMPRTEHMPLMRQALAKHERAAGIGCAAAVFLLLLKQQIHFIFPAPAAAAGAGLAITALAAAALADSAYRILPDQLTAFIFFSGLFAAFISDLTILFLGKPIPLTDLLFLFGNEAAEGEYFSSFRCSTADYLPSSAVFSHTASALAGSVCGFLLLLLCSFLSLVCSGRQGIGMGDVKLTGACGTLAGIQDIFFLIFLSSSLTALSIIKGRLTEPHQTDTAKPAGPWIFIAAACCLLWK